MPKFPDLGRVSVSDYEKGDIHTFLQVFQIDIGPGIV
jgi:hypothetical protein